MNLIAKGIEVGNPDIQVDSNKDKRTVVMLAIFADVFTGHEAHVSIKDQLRPRNSAATPGAVYLRTAHNTVKVGNRGNLKSLRNGEHMEQFCSRAERLDTTRDGPGRRVGSSEGFLCESRADAQ